MLFCCRCCCCHRQTVDYDATKLSIAGYCIWWWPPTVIVIVPHVVGKQKRNKHQPSVTKLSSRAQPPRAKEQQEYWFHFNNFQIYLPFPRRSRRSKITTGDVSGTLSHLCGQHWLCARPFHHVALPRMRKGSSSATRLGATPFLCFDIQHRQFEDGPTRVLKFKLTIFNDSSLSGRLAWGNGGGQGDKILWWPPRRVLHQRNTGEGDAM